MSETPKVPELAQEVLTLLSDDSLQRLSGRKGYVQALSEFDTVGVIEALIPLVYHAGDPEIRYRALDVLMVLNPEVGVPLANSLLESPDATMRWLAAGLLSNHGDELAIGPLLKRLHEDPEPDVRFVAALALGRIGDRSVLPHLQEALDDKGADWEGHRVCEAAAKAIEEISQRHPAHN